MRKSLKITIILVLALISLATVSYGFGVGELKGSEANLGSLKKAGNSIVGIISTSGIVISVVVVAILGVKFLIGSADERAEYKKTLMPYLIGAVLVFGASTIANIVYLFVK